MEFTTPKSKGFTIYSKSGCPNCTIAKKLLKEKFFLMEEINCDEYILEDKEGFLTFIETIGGKIHKTFPMIFYDGLFVGGLNETKEFTEKLVLSFEENF